MKKESNPKQNGETKNDQAPAGYELGLNLRRTITRRAGLLGKALNTGQHRLGLRTTGLLLTLIWTIALYYFLNLLVSLFEKL